MMVFVNVTSYVAVDVLQHQYSSYYQQSSYIVNYYPLTNYARDNYRNIQSRLWKDREIAMIVDSVFTHINDIPFRPTSLDIGFYLYKALQL